MALHDKTASMTTLRPVSSTSWTLLAVTTCALVMSACKKDAGSQPPADDAGGGSDVADAGGGGGDASDDDAGPDFLTVDDFEEIVGKNTGDVTDCFSTAKAAKPDLAGKLAYDFTIDGAGKVTELKLDPSSTVKDPALNTCVTDKAKGWQFPKTRDGQPMTLPYSFNLS